MTGQEKFSACKALFVLIALFFVACGVGIAFGRALAYLFIKLFKLIGI